MAFWLAYVMCIMNENVNTQNKCSYVRTTHTQHTCCHCAHTHRLFLHNTHIHKIHVHNQIQQQQQKIRKL